MDWVEYFRRRPIGWRDDHRACYGLSAQGVKAKPHELFSSIRAIEKDREELENASTANDANKLLGSQFFNKLMVDTNWDVEV
jgi:hypothetical protein